MLLASVLAIPLWVSILGYFLIGTLWAFIYLPRSISLQAARYRTWRDSVTEGRPLREVLGAESTSDGKTLHPTKFQQMRDHPDRGGGFTERQILVAFMANIAFWPWKLIKKVVLNVARAIEKVLQRVLDWLELLLTNLWDKVLLPLLKHIGRAIRHGLRALRSGLRWIVRIVRTVWNSYVVPAYRAMVRTLRKWADFIWNQVLRAVYHWVYRHVTGVYQAIIQLANREAIADMKMLNPDSKEEK